MFYTPLNGVKLPMPSICYSRTKNQLKITNSHGSRAASFDNIGLHLCSTQSQKAQTVIHIKTNIKQNYNQKMNNDTRLTDIIIM